MKQNLIILLLGASLLGGCSTWDKLDNKERGAVIGGGSGALLGNAVAPGAGGTIIGGAAGAVAGGVVGNEMDKSEKEKRRRY